MTKEAKAKIFLADERGLNQTNQFRSENTFCFGNYRDENKKPFGKIYVLNDDMLTGGQSMRLMAEEKTWAIVLPVAGAVECKINESKEELVAAGQAISYLLDAGDVIEIKNPFVSDTVNFLQLWMRATDENELATGIYTYADLNGSMNELVPALSKTAPGFSVHIGKFSGRGETVYNITGNNAGCFLFILNGAFEAAGRLLHDRDGLAIWDTREIDMEALSSDAILLLVETSL